MAVRQEAPLQKGPIIRPPEGRAKGIRNALIVTTAATSLAVAGLIGYEAIKPKQGPEPTPIAGGIGEPTPSITPEATIFVSPSPEITQSPTPERSPTPDTRNWWEKIPENPYKNINEVPLAPDSFGNVAPSRLFMVPYSKNPWFFIEMQPSTIVSVDPDVKNNTVWVALATDVPGAKIKKEGCKIFYIVNNNAGNKTFCNYTGPAVWVEIGNKTIIREGNDTDLGKGAKTIASHLKVGQKIKPLIGFSYSPQGIASKDQINMNSNSWRKLEASVGKSYTRSDRRFSFFSGIVSVYPNQ